VVRPPLGGGVHRRSRASTPLGVARAGVPRHRLEELLLWTLGGTLVGARLYFILQNDPLAYAREPWRMLAVWEGGPALFWRPARRDRGGMAVHAARRLPFSMNGGPVRARLARAARSPNAFIQRSPFWGAAK